MTGYSPGHRYFLLNDHHPDQTVHTPLHARIHCGQSLFAWEGAISWLQRITRTGKEEGLPWHRRAAVNGNGSPCVKRPSRTSMFPSRTLMFLRLSFKIMHMLHFPLFRFSSSRPGEWLQGQNVRGTRVPESMSFTTKQRRDSLTALTTLNLSYSSF